ncbi:MAG: hypothetical protein OXC82_11470 [Rhodobacteraceae bacterium]|nr:hypothetical protein [Paracoccaceae bacterium]
MGGSGCGKFGDRHLFLRRRVAPAGIHPVNETSECWETPFTGGFRARFASYFSNILQAGPNKKYCLVLWADRGEWSRGDTTNIIVPIAWVGFRTGPDPNPPPAPVLPGCFGDPRGLIACQYAKPADTRQYLRKFRVLRRGRRRPPLVFHSDGIIVTRTAASGSAHFGICEVICIIPFLT